jgi:hypothetical protein
MHLRLLVLAISAVIVAGCGLFNSKEARFLCGAQDRASQVEVKQEMGEPVASASGPDGQTVWVYQVRTLYAGSRINAAGTWCEEYVLTFDRQNVLRNWTQKKQFHGGETQPQYCVVDGYRS